MPYASVQRQGIPNDRRNQIVHEGAIGTFGKPGDYRTEQKKYKDWLKEPRIENASTGGWLGITDKYWLAALLPQQNEAVETEFRVRDLNGAQQLEANVLGTTRTIQPGATATETQRLFAGVKRAEVLKTYEAQLNLPRFVYAIDWGMFWFLTRPIFWILENVYGLVGSFGVAILALTVIVKLVMFPLANNAYASMSKMRDLQPK
ncbi:membrane protein insertase YidC, partial [Sphingomonas adhaesiva]|uniref:membrane protein insertase YidC n=1 Tax=Sphingomonas adhaesiva TaxID=28212 RepID=UPI0035C71193